MPLAEEEVKSVSIAEGETGSKPEAPFETKSVVAVGEQEDDGCQTIEEIIEEAKGVLQAEPLETALAADMLLMLDEKVSPSITKELLSSTKIGQIVNKLKSAESPDVSTRAKMIIEKWKMIIKAPSTTSAGEGQTAAEQQTAQQSESSARKRPLPQASAAADSFEPAVHPLTHDSVYEGKMTKQDKRNRFRSILFKSFVEGFAQDQIHMVDKVQLDNLIAEVETALWDYHVTKKNNQNDYTSQLRSIKSNLADKKNPEFNSALYMGGISVEDLPTMSSVEMASDAKKQERKKAQKDALEACQSDWDLRNVKRAKGQFPCGKCKSDNTTYVQMQTRSSDEPMTTYVSCQNCGNRWKF
ncbi:putative transcription elongation factor [Gregarina niphandrodes]|uniref:Transcription elongation factor n=1 Tax=Gregarina niphandrodes TaxID=110365 RepID=A0A023B3G7_GRENI|nr:putative transcription elongation factor [Gregarina niphandrodes]EZG55327.1 putative transcription elongation factor [Gregarina niphandrodes]|eukprot:XP_011131622.1 putative transcription elongation factor [Gregarina niphandrodes]